MKFLKLKFSSARLIKETKKTNRLGSNRFYHPINKYHVYNSVCVLFGRTPKPQLRKTDDKYLPIYNDIEDAVFNGYIKTKLILEHEKVTTIKKCWNSNVRTASQYTWVDVKYVLGSLLPIFLEKISLIVNIEAKKLGEMHFEDVIDYIHSIGEKKEDGKVIYSDEKVIELIMWCKRNKCTPISNYIENKNLGSLPTEMGKRVYRGIVDASKFSGEIYIPLTLELFDELIKYTKGFSTILDGGLVRIVDYDYVKEYDLEDFIKISDLNDTRKFYDETSEIIWDNTIFKDIKSETLIDDVNNIISKSGITIDENDKFYQNMIDKIKKIKFDKNRIGEIAFKVNYFIEESINKMYK